MGDVYVEYGEVFRWFWALLHILDLVFSNEVSMIEDLKVLEHFSTSDHNMLDLLICPSLKEFSPHDSKGLQSHHL